MAACLSLIFLSLTAAAQEQPLPTIAVISIDSKTIQSQDSETIAYMVRLELEKTGLYNVMYRYEVAEIVAKNNLDISGCYAKSCLIATGRALGWSLPCG